MRISFHLFFVCFLFASCISKPPAPKEIKNISYPSNGDLDSGSFDSITYKNNYFGFAFESPKANWYILDQEQYHSRIKGNMDMLENKGADDSASIKSEQNIHNLFTIRKNHSAASGPNYQSISFMAEGIEKIPNVSDSKGYVLFTENYIKKHLSTGYPTYTVLPLDNAMLGNREFILATWKIETSDGDTYFQKTYTAQFGKYLLNVIVNYQTKEDSLENEKILSTVKWNKL